MSTFAGFIGNLVDFESRVKPKAHLIGVLGRREDDGSFCGEMMGCGIDLCVDDVAGDIESRPLRALGNELGGLPEQR